MPETNISFSPKARIILQLGDQLIRSENIAVLELIKNSYDACATQVTIRMNHIDNKDFGSIIIEDNGSGMTYNHIRDVWLTPGTTFKKKQIEKGEFIEGCGRVPLGEKGIGRFGAHKLGEEIEMISKKEGKKEAYLKINWEDFDTDEQLDAIPIQLEKREQPEYFTNGETGTKIIIKRLRQTWTRGTLRSLYRAVNTLNSPFKANNSFKVIFKTDQPSWVSGLLSFEDIKDSALFEADLTISGDQITKFTYEFTPWEALKQLKGRRLDKEDIPMRQKEYDIKLKKKEFKDIDLSNYNIGKVEMKLLIFDLDATVLSLGNISDKRGFKSYLKDNGGIRVYRDGVRVYDYGEPGNDWLNLDIERVNLPTARISNNIVIGAISLDRLDSKDLKEKTNREGFIEDDAFKAFYSAIRFAIAQVVVQRNIDKDKIRSHYGKTGKKVPVVDNLNILREKVDSSLPPSEDKKVILGMITDIEADYKTISEVYMRSASAGLSLSIVIHEIEKIIKEMMLIVDQNKDTAGESKRIKSLTSHMSKLIDGYSGLIRRRSRKESDLIKIIKQAIWNIEFRLKAHGVSIVGDWNMLKGFETKVKCSDSLIMGSIINIIDNSIWWMNYGKVPDKKVWIDVNTEHPNHLTIIIADNGPGFTLPTEDIVKPFISNKDGGIGIGLHIAYEVMNGHGGELIFPSIDQFSIPEEFETGAIVALAFKLN